MGFNVKKDEDEAQVNELVDVIDRLMMGGQGHLTIDIDETEEGLNVKTYSTSYCGGSLNRCEIREFTSNIPAS